MITAEDAGREPEEDLADLPVSTPQPPRAAGDGLLSSVMSSIKKKSPQPPGLADKAGDKVGPSNDYPQQQNNSFRKQPVE